MGINHHKITVMMRPLTGVIPALGSLSSQSGQKTSFIVLAIQAVAGVWFVHAHSEPYLSILKKD